MVKYVLGVVSFFFPLVALANGEEDPSVIHQLEELLPFEHLEHGHWVSAVLSLILWVSLLYTVFAILKKFRKSPMPQQPV